MVTRVCRPRFCLQLRGEGGRAGLDHPCERLQRQAGREYDRRHLVPLVVLLYF